MLPLCIIVYTRRCRTTAVVYLSVVRIKHIISTHRHPHTHPVSMPIVDHDGQNTTYLWSQTKRRKHTHHMPNVLDTKSRTSRQRSKYRNTDGKKKKKKIPTSKGIYINNAATATTGGEAVARHGSVVQQRKDGSSPVPQKER